MVPDTTFTLPEELLVARKELDGHYLWLTGQPTRAIEALREAQVRELQLRYTEPTYYPRPVAEVLNRLTGAGTKSTNA